MLGRTCPKDAIGYHSGFGLSTILMGGRSQDVLENTEKRAPEAGAPRIVSLHAWFTAL
jgi:hypothetical protein